MDYLQLFVDSYKRVLVSDRRDENFFDAFYRLFISRSPQAAGMLHTSIDHMIYFSMDRRATETLLEAVRLIDPDYDDDIDLAWRVVLAPGVTYMKRKYDTGDL